MGTLGKHCARESDCPPFARQNCRYLTRSRAACKTRRSGVSVTCVCHRTHDAGTASMVGLRPWTIDGGPAVGTERRGEAGCLLLGCSSLLAPRLLVATRAQSVGESPSVLPLPPRSTRPQLRTALQLRSRRAWGNRHPYYHFPRGLRDRSYGPHYSYARAERGGNAIRTTTSPAVYATAATDRITATLAQSVGETPYVLPLPPRSTRPQLRSALLLRSRRAWGRRHPGRVALAERAE